jgi:putative phosphoribosyl transferase
MISHLLGKGQNAMTVFANRQEAAKQLAERLMHFKDVDPVILALPRGGVPIGFEAAKALEAALDLVLVRKIGAPHQPELAIAAIVDRPHAEIVINEDIVKALGIPQSYIDDECARQLEEIERRRALYLAGRSRVDLAQKTVIVVDDGIATGATVRAALHALKRTNLSRLVLAVPVAPPETLATLQEGVDELICLFTPTYLGGIGTFYIDFHQVSDDEVVEMLRQCSDREEADHAPSEPFVSPEAGAPRDEPNAAN